MTNCMEKKGTSKKDRSRDERSRWKVIEHESSKKMQEK